MKTKEIDVQLQVKILQGNTTQREKDKAGSLLVQRFNMHLFYFILKMVKHQEDAEDILQKVWAKAFQRIRQYQPTHQFSTWLYKIASHQIIDENRKRKLNVVSLDVPLDTEPSEDDQMRPRELMMNLADDAPNPEQEMHLEARREMCLKLIEQLSPQLKKLVLMRYMDDKSYEEIAEETGIPLGTVKGNLFRARAKMEAIAMDCNLQERY